MGEIAQQIETIDKRLRDAEKWFNENENVDPTFWDRCFDKFIELLRERARLHLLDTPTQKTLF